ncbi:hypothetical protein [Flavobacterium petrolei]|uniref:hypothetical protein n=1 Tax=Flavobacterium petrolei TaxID=2259594 RepID=UPI003756F208
MNTKIKLLLTFLVISNIAFAQNAVKMTNNYGSENSEIQNIIDFENIYIEKLNFESKELNGKFITLSIDEYKNGKLKKTSILFDGSESDYFKIGSDKESLKFFFKMTDGKLKTYIRGQKFGSKKSFFKLFEESEKYALKDFFGSKKELNLDISKKNAVFAIITPTIHKDGSGSYCEVAQSNIEAKKLGEHFNIPHYFIINIEFK